LSYVVKVIGINHIEAYEHPPQWETKPHAIGQQDEKKHFQFSSSFVSLIEDKGQEIDASAIQFLIEFNQSDQSNVSCC